MGADRGGGPWPGAADTRPATGAIRLAGSRRNRQSGTGLRWLVGGCVLGAILLSLVALASRPSAAAHGSVGRAPALAGSVVETALLLIGVLDLILLAVIVYAILPDRLGKGREEEKWELYQPPRVHWAWKLAAVALPFLLVAGLLVVALLVSHQLAPHTQLATPQPAGTTGPRLPPRHATQPSAHPGLLGVSWIEVAAAVLLALMALAVVLRSFRSSPISRGGKPRLIQDLATALDDSLEDLTSEVEPRRAVIAAYAKMERILAAHGCPRHTFEAPREYLDRAFRGLETDATALRVLTELFELAKFSHHEVSGRMKERAISALTSVRDGLRSSA